MSILPANCLHSHLSPYLAQAPLAIMLATKRSREHILFQGRLKQMLAFFNAWNRKGKHSKFEVFDFREL